MNNKEQIELINNFIDEKREIIKEAVYAAVLHGESCIHLKYKGKAEIDFEVYPHDVDIKNLNLMNR